MTVASDRQPQAGRRRPALAVAAMVLAGLTGLVLASLIGFAPAWHRVGVPSPASSGQPPGMVAPARTSGSHGTAPAAGPRPQAAGPPAPSRPPPAPARPGPAQDRGHGHGHGDGKGPGKNSPNG